MSRYTERYKSNPELVKKLEKIYHLLQTIGGIDDNIDFDLDMEPTTGEIYELSIYISGKFGFFGLLTETVEILDNLDNKMRNVFKKIKLDEHLNLNRSYQNDFNGGMLTYLNYDYNNETLSYDIHFLLTI